jgi:UTP-glucose-1-phosphate uridylyltransferase
MTLNNEKKPVCYAVFGQYVITPDIFRKLKESIQDEVNPTKEVDMTDALCQFIGKGLTGIKIDGQMYDIGNPAAYQKTAAAFANFQGVE